MLPPEIQLRLQEDFADAVLGSILIALGIAALALGAVRARSTSRPLIYLGVANCLYGLRLIADTDLLGAWVGIPGRLAVWVVVVITYVMPLPAILFTEWALGRGWRSSIRLALRVQIVYAAGAILIDAVRGPGTAMGINNLVVLFGLAIGVLNGALHLRKNPGALRTAARTRAGKVVIAGAAVFLALVINENLVEAGLVPWGVSAEPLGILALGGAIVYAFVHRVLANERRLAGISQELETARRIQSSLLPRRMPEVRGLHLAARYLPMADVGGDLYDFLAADSERVGILVADVSGHGVPAALIASMVKVALAAQAEHAADPAAVLAGMNRILHGNLERGFVTAAYLYLGTETATYASAGHPPLLVRREGGVEEVRQESLPLGRFRRAEYRNEGLRLSPGDRLLLYTDGVTEARSPAGEPFGDERLRDLLDSSGEPDAILGRLAGWTGRGAGEPLDDDVTLVAASIRPLSASDILEGHQGEGAAAMSLDSGAQLILQSESEGEMSCVGFKGLPVVNPAFIALLHAGSPEAIADADALRQELEREIRALAPRVESAELPCPESAPREPSWRKLLVLVGDEKTPISWRSSFKPWRTEDPMYAVLPVFPRTARTGITSRLPEELHAVNVEFWSRTVEEAIPAVLARAGLTSGSSRIFISYRQKESAALAMQLFDGLAHESFDVFLDHYRIDPGVNFQARLTQELGDKSMLLLIESAGILASEWTTYEINVAKQCGLGILALHPPGGRAVDGVDEAVRQRLGDGDFTGGAFSASAVLEPAALANVIERVKREHDRALVRRRRVLRTSFQDALLLEGVSDHYFDEHGILHVIRPGVGEYRVWLTPRPPDLEDFHLTHLHCQTPVRGVVIGLARLMEPPRLRRTDWLAGLCQFRLFDEGRLKEAAAAIARGTL